MSSLDQYFVLIEATAENPLTVGCGKVLPGLSYLAVGSPFRITNALDLNLSLIVESEVTSMNCSCLAELKSAGGVVLKGSRIQSYFAGSCNGKCFCRAEIFQVFMHGLGSQCSAVCSALFLLFASMFALVFL